MFSVGRMYEGPEGVKKVLDAVMKVLRGAVRC